MALPNIDYLIVARLGGRLPSRVLALGGVGPESLTACAKVARQERVTADEQWSALRYATIFWYATFWISFIAFFLLMFVVAAIAGRDELGGAWSVVPGLAIGGLALSGTAVVFTMIRHRNLDNRTLVGGGGSRRLVATMPRPYDFWIEVAAGILGVFVFVLIVTTTP